MTEPASSFSAEEEAAFRKVSKRILWFLFILTVINYLDRTNIGFAQLTMGKDLGISATVFGWSIAIFSFVYALFEIPSNLALQKFGARVWITRIMITWGLAAAGCAFAVGEWSFLTLRALVGAAEAGFIPGLVLYMTYWYPQFFRARAQSGFMIAQPVAVAGGSILSGFLLQMDGLWGIAGWRWLLIIEGLPAVLLGIAVWFYLTDRPSKSAWLTPRERELIDAAVKRDADAREQSAAHQSGSIWDHLFSRNLLLISCAYFMLVGNFGSAGYWTPQIVRAISSPNQPFWITGLISAGPHLCALCCIPLWSAYSDRIRERYWCVIIPMILGGCGWMMAAQLTLPALQFLGLVIASISTLSVWSLFFTMPSNLLPRTSHATGIAFMNTIGMCGAGVAPLVMGYLRDATGGFTAPMTVIGLGLVVGACLMMCVPRYLLVGDGKRKDDGAVQPARA